MFGSRPGYVCYLPRVSALSNIDRTLEEFVTYTFNYRDLRAHIYMHVHNLLMYINICVYVHLCTHTYIRVYILWEGMRKYLPPLQNFLNETLYIVKILLAQLICSVISQNITCTINLQRHLIHTSYKNSLLFVE